MSLQHSGPSVSSSISTAKTSLPSSSSGAGAPPSALTISHPAHALLLSRAHSPDTAARIFTDKIKNKPLLLQPTELSSSGARSGGDRRALRRHVRDRKKAYHRRKQRPQPLSAKEKREGGFYNLKGQQGGECRYEVYEKLNKLWKGYMWEVLGFVRDGDVVAAANGTAPNGTNRESTSRIEGSRGGKGGGKKTDGKMGGAGGGGTATRKIITPIGHGSLLATADFHGMAVEIVRCPDTGRVGTKGIVVRETKFSFVLVCPGNKVRQVLKRKTVFRVELPLPEEDEIGLKADDLTDLKPTEGGEGGEGEDTRKKIRSTLILELHGSQVEIRPVDRAVKKFKWRSMSYL